MDEKKYLIKNSTKEERAKLMRDTLVLTTLDSKAPLKEDMELYEKYIDGEMEIDEVLQKHIEKYKEN